MSAAGLSSRKMMLCNFKSAKGDGGGAGTTRFVGDVKAAALDAGNETAARVDAGCAAASDWGSATGFVRTTMLVLTVIVCFR